MDNHTQDRYQSKKHYKNNANIKDQAFYTTACLEDRASATATEDTAKPGTTHLEQNKHNNDYRDNDLYDSDSWNPLCQETVLAFLFYELISGKLYHSLGHSSSVFVPTL